MTSPRFIPLLVAALLVTGCATTHGDGDKTAKAPSGKATNTATTKIKVARAPIDGHRRLAYDVIPTHYALDLAVDPRRETFSGKVTVSLKVKNRTTEIRLHAEGPKVTKVELERAGGTVAAYAETGKNGGLAIRFKEPLALGDAKLHMEYEAPLPETPLGIYRVKSDGHWYAYTQFEPLEARRAFPSFDQPEFKTPFSTTLRVPKGMTALTNGPEKAQRPDGEKWVAFDFAETKPIPTYLVAFAVGPFDIVEAPKHDGLPRMRTVTTKGKGKLATWANLTTQKVLLSLQKYFGEPYPYAKLDQVAVPNFGSGAMENVGLVTYRERLLLLGDGTKAPPSAKLWGTVVIAHELGHMWFGNKVTLSWWDDLWLNEAFATWISFKIAHDVAPELEAPVSMRGRVGYTMSWDAQRASRAIRQPIRHGGDVYNAFDPITYGKGAAVLNMLEAWLGEDAFRKGLRAYVKAHAHGVAKTPDLLKALSEASGKDVTKTVAMFLDQPGTPLVDVTTTCAKGPDAKPELQLKQTRYLPAKSTTPKGKPWRIPMCVRFGAGKKVARHCGALEGATGTMALPVKWCPDWVHPNDDERGYYRWNIGAKAMKALVTTHRKQLTLVEKVAMADHFKALLEADAIDATLVLDGLKALSKETHHHIVDSLIRPLQTFSKHVSPALKARFATKVVKTILGPHIKRLGFATKPNPKAKTFADSLLRPKLSKAFFDLMGDKAGNLRKAVQKAAALGLADMAKADVKVFTAAVPLAGRHGGKAYIAKVKEVLDKAPTPAHRVAMVQALGAAADAEAAKAGLDLLLDGTLRAQDVREMRRFSSGRAAVVKAGWDWLTTNYDKMVKFVGTKSARGLVWFGAGLCTPEAKTEFKTFFSAPARDTVGTKRMAHIVGEMIDRCIQMRAAVRPTLDTYLGGK